VKKMRIILEDKRPFETPYRREVEIEQLFSLYPEYAAQIENAINEVKKNRRKITLWLFHTGEEWAYVEIEP